jgi:diguanylate cyclase (GGDEF)-like protein
MPGQNNATNCFLDYFWARCRAEPSACSPCILSPRRSEPPRAVAQVSKHVISLTTTSAVPALPSLSLRSLRSRIIASVLILIVLIQVGAFALIATVGAGSVRQSVSSEVGAGTKAFERVLDLDTQRMAEGMGVLAGDPAFRDGITANDRNALATMLAKQGKRIGAPLMMVVGPDHRVIAATLEPEIGRRIGFPKLLDRAAAAQQASGITPIGGRLYQLSVVPVMAPLPVAWVIAGFNINDTLAQELKGLTGLEVSFLGRHEEGEWKLAASTLAEPERSALAKDVGANRYASTNGEGNAEYGDDAVTRVVNLAPRSDDAVVALLQARYEPAFEPFRAMQRQLAIVSVLGILAACVIGMLLARTVAGPLRELASAARRVAVGDYKPVAVGSRKDEIGELAGAFRAMQEGVASSVQRMTELAHRDSLTGLPTRVLFVDRLEQSIAGAARAGSPVSVLVMDLDQFAHVNDTLGHAIGDLQLREVAARLRSVIRRASDSVARIGADEFAIMMPGSRTSDAQRVAQAVRHALEVKMTLDGHVVDCRASIGIASCPDHGVNPAKLIERADVAMRAAKQDQLGIAVWDERYDQNGEKRLSLMSDLRSAVERDELALIYQPKIALGDAGEHFVEALVRWQHPQRGLVPPSEFVPLAEQTGYIRTITQWVLGRAIKQCAEWRSRGLPMNVTVNISARDLIDGDLPARLKEMLEGESVAAQWLTLEFTENAIVGEPGHAFKNLERLREVGCKLAVDDYGTGYSSLAYLRRLPLDELKIDKSFIMGMAEDASDALIVRSTIELAHKLGLTVVASGVEDEATLAQLRELGCDSVQGFLLSRPMPAEEVPAWVKESVWTRSAREKGSLRRVI